MILSLLLDAKIKRMIGMKFKKLIDLIEDFLHNTPKDIFEFSVLLEDMLVDDYDEMYSEQPAAVYYLSQEVPEICSEAEPGMTTEEIKLFKEKISAEFEKAKKLITSL